MTYTDCGCVAADDDPDGANSCCTRFDGLTKTYCAEVAVLSLDLKLAHAALAESDARLHRALTVVEQYHHVTARNDAQQVIELYRTFKQALMTEAERKAEDVRPQDLRDVENTRLCIQMARAQSALKDSRHAVEDRVTKALEYLRGER